MLGQLTEYMKTVRKDFLIHSGSEKDTSAVSICTPELINNITWIRQLDAKVIFCLLYQSYKLISCFYYSFPFFREAFKNIYMVCM